jgi:hypothetical protein
VAEIGGLIGAGQYARLVDEADMALPEQVNDSANQPVLRAAHDCLSVGHGGGPLQLLAGL